MTFAIVESSSGAASASARNPPIVSAFAGSISMPPTVTSSCSRYRNRVATPKLPPPPRIAQNRVRVLLGVDVEELAVGRDDLGREQVVDREAVLADEVSDPSAGA